MPGAVTRRGVRTGSGDEATCLPIVGEIVPDEVQLLKPQIEPGLGKGSVWRLYNSMRR